MRQLTLVLLLIACAPARRPWPRDPRIQFDGARLRAYGASMTSQAAAHKDALDALRLYLARSAPALRVEAVLKDAKAKPVPAREPGTWTSVVDLSTPEVQRLLGTRYD